ncbi:MAG: hypothetical protein ACXVDF_02655 [Ktedonobacterales bacterium]
MIKKSHALLSALILIGMLVALDGCGRNASAQPGAGRQLDSVRIENDLVKPIVTLTVTTLVQQLYATIYALPQMPKQQACTNERGPHYALTFLEGNQTVITVRAERDGCRPVTISGELHSRKGTTEFWTQLDQAIYQGTPPAKPDLFAIAYSPDPAQTPKTARITSPETAQRLYNAILALPVHPYGDQCPTPSAPTYQFAFHTPQQTIPATIDPTCKTITLNGAYQTRGGTYTLNDQFNRLFAEIVAGANFAPAQPDKLTLTIQTLYTASHQSSVANTVLVQQLYHKVWTLQPTMTQPDCLSTDKAAGKGTWYTFAFSQWDLSLLGFDAFEGSCRYITRFVSGQIVQGDQALWDLLHQAAGQ